ncbi:Matrixin [Lentilactobacillus kisonensis DSM 19906 = JCM 15041]|uniref:Matrixin n=2 Tax=Lentilactobacillus kisonensis TaxID=481722 RepID=H1LCF7_9LACO|nr:Matrixin [Lentilactobacillus kisonensis F0435]KRL22641.1 Matrixin [Lentilactobacillus kisonensis DSM 19906 = JCM 15041]
MPVKPKEVLSVSEKIIKHFTIAFLVSFILLLGGSIKASAVAPITPHGTARFESATATIDTTNNSVRYQKIWDKAVQAWNQTGVFEFVPTTDSDAQVTTSTNSGLGGAYTGMTYITTGSDGYIQHTESELNPQTLKVYRYSTSEMVNVAEHELGHSIGLLHNPNRASVMFAANRYYSIQAVDSKSVQQLYTTQADRIAISNKKIIFRDPVNIK